VFDTGLAMALDALDSANALAADVPGAPARFEVTLAGVGERATSHHGQGIAVAPLTSLAAPPELVIVPALAARRMDDLAARLTGRDVAEAGAALKRWSGEGAVSAAACTGTFVLGGAGLLDGRRATTTWWLAPDFRARFPRVSLDESRMVVDAGEVVTAGAALAHLDLLLALIRRRSPALAGLVARYLALEERASQAPYLIPAHLARQDPLVEAFERLARQRLAAPFDLARAARALGTTPRTLQRRVAAVLGKSPLAFVQDLRVERASHLLKASGRPLEEIAAEVGYADAVALRALLRRKLGRSVRELRGQ
jgi:transcriptional regulator GlxA family with amidase domain